MFINIVRLPNYHCNIIIPGALIYDLLKMSYPVLVRGEVI